MDHSSANLIEFTSDPIETKTLESQFTHQEKEQTLHEGEKRMHNKEQHVQSEYYKKLGDVIKGYESVLLFGPTEAKTELLHILKADRRFEKIIIVMRQADKMTDNQQHAFVKDYFSRRNHL